MFTGASSFLTSLSGHCTPLGSIHNFFSVMIFINFYVIEIVGFETIWTVINGIQNAVFQLFCLCSHTTFFEFQRGKMKVGLSKLV